MIVVAGLLLSGLHAGRAPSRAGQASGSAAGIHPAFSATVRRPISPVVSLDAAPQADARNIALAGQIGGAISAVAVTGRYAYVGVGPRLVILDISDPAHPLFVGQTAPLSDNITEVAVAGSYAYVTAGSALWALAINDPASPLVTGAVDLGAAAGHVAVAGEYAYVTAGRTLTIVKISQAGTPMKAGVYDAPWSILTVAAADDSVYLGCYEFSELGGSRGGIFVISVADSAAPVSAGRYSEVQRPTDIVVIGSLAYVVGYGVLHVLSVADPAAPLEIGALPLDSRSADLAVAGSYAYVGAGSIVQVVRIANPAAPVATGVLTALQVVRDVAASGQYTYVADSTKFQVIDNSIPATPTITGSYGGLTRAQTVSIAGAQAFVTGGAFVTQGVSDLSILTTGPAFDASEVSTTPLEDSIGPAVVEGRYAYVISRTGFTVLDIANPAAPVAVGAYQTTGPVRGLAVAGHLAYSAEEARGLRIIDISDPAAPHEIGAFDTPELSVYDVAVAGALAYVADGYDGVQGGIRIVDITNPLAPAQIGAFKSAGFAFGLELAGDQVYIAYEGDRADNKTVRIVDVGNPVDPIEIGSIRSGGTPRVRAAWLPLGLAVNGDLLYLLSGSYYMGIFNPPAELPSYLEVYDVWNPAVPILVGTYRVSTQPAQCDRASCIAADTHYAYIAAGDGGLVLLQVVDSYADRYEPDNTCTQSTQVAADGALHVHTFHQQADTDWSWFDATAGTTYIVETRNTGAHANTVIEPYATCTAPASGAGRSFGPGYTISFTAPATGRTYLKVFNHDPSAFGADTGYTLSVRAVQPSAVALIVAGHDDARSAQDNITYAADRAYRTFRNAGIPKANVRYLAPLVSHDADSDGSNDIAGLPTVANIRDAVQNWTRERGVALGVPFYLYLVDHGLVDRFKADGDAAVNQITATDLNLWLSNLEATSGADNINVIIDACYSGSFIDETAAGAASIAGRNRVVIASTTSDWQAFGPAGGQGLYFSNAFFGALENEQSLYASYLAGRQAVEAQNLLQRPWLDDNDDHRADTADGTLASNRVLQRVALGGQSPDIEWVRGDACTGQLQAKISDDSTQVSVQVEVFPPSYISPQPDGSGTTRIVSVPVVSLIDSDGDGIYTGTFAFTESGAYRLVAHAQDAEGNLALPVSGGAGAEPGDRLHLPLILCGQ